MSRPETIDAAAAKIGPNAVIQLLAALRSLNLAPLAAPLFRRAGVGDWYPDPPDAMLDAAGAGRLHRTVRAVLPAPQAQAVLGEAGRLTADYLLAHRIPRPAQRVLRLLPAPLAARALVPAIRAHAWTFAGAGQVTAGVGQGAWFAIAANPLCGGETSAEPVCVWHAAVFQRLFQALVSPAAQARETDCAACGAAACHFAVTWD